jgi:hypothetical protein
MAGATVYIAKSALEFASDVQKTLWVEEEAAPSSQADQQILACG